MKGSMRRPAPGLAPLWPMIPQQMAISLNMYYVQYRACREMGVLCTVNTDVCYVSQAWHDLLQVHGSMHHPDAHRDTSNHGGFVQEDVVVEGRTLISFE